MRSRSLKYALPLIVVTLALLWLAVWAPAQTTSAGAPPNPPVLKNPTPGPWTASLTPVPLIGVPVQIKDKDGNILLETTSDYFNAHVRDIEKQLNIDLGSDPNRSRPDYSGDRGPGMSPRPAPPIEFPGTQFSGGIMTGGSKVPPH